MTCCIVGFQDIPDLENITPIRYPLNKVNNYYTIRIRVLNFIRNSQLAIKND
jgi:hypothetical protein